MEIECLTPLPTLALNPSRLFVPSSLLRAEALQDTTDNTDKQATSKHGKGTTGAPG